MNVVNDMSYDMNVVNDMSYDMNVVNDMSYDMIVGLNDWLLYILIQCQ